MSSLAQSLFLAGRGLINYITKRPFCVSFEITHRCNARCKHCNRGGPVDEEWASAQRFGQIVREIKPLIAQLSGGEPLLRKDLEKIIEAIRNPRGTPYIIVITNGILLTKEKYFRLKEAGVDEFSISLDYPDERHDEFRRVPGLFRRIKELVKDLSSEEKKAITLCCVIQSDNFRDLIRMAYLAKGWNVKINFSAYNTLRTNDKSYMLSKGEIEEFKEIIKKLLDFKRRYKTIYTSRYVFEKTSEFFEKGSIPDCRTGERFFNVNPDGTFSPCGLIIKDYRSQRELSKNISKNSICNHCFTSIRANSEKPLRYLIKDSLYTLRHL